MKYLAILAVLTLACSGEDITPRQCHSMTLSDANPVQFWPIDCETWNESRPKGVHHYCFCQPFECDDEININLESSDERSVDQMESTFNNDLSGWFNTANGVTPGTGGSTSDWAWSSNLGGSAKVTTLNTFGTKGIRLSGVSVPQQTFTLRVKYAIPAVRNSSNLKFQFIIRDASLNQLFNQAFGLTSTGTEQTQDFIISNPTIWSGADHFWIITNSTGYVAGDDMYITEISFIYDTPIEYKLKAFDESDILLASVQFQRIGTHYDASFTPSDYSICDKQINLKIFSSSINAEIDPLDEWVNENTGSGPSWAPGSSTPNVTMVGLVGTTTDELTSNLIAYIAGEYTFDYTVYIGNGNPSVTLDIHVKGYKSGLSVGDDFITKTITDPTQEITDIITVNFSDTPDKVALYVFISALASGGSTYVELRNFSLPSVPDVELYKSDCLDIKTSHNESLLINYSNHSDFAGINYPNITPDPSFNIRIPAVFFIDRYPQEGEDFTLSNNTVLALNSQVKLQRQLSTDRMPKYMHKKMVLVLQHQFLYIDGEYWIKGQEEYSKSEKKNKRDSFDMYTCWLTNKNFVVRNIL